jgi:hypothetical protein
MKVDCIPRADMAPHTRILHRAEKEQKACHAPERAEYDRSVP